MGWGGGAFEPFRCANAKNSIGTHIKLKKQFKFYMQKDKTS